MKRFIQNRSNRYGYDGWALMNVKSKHIYEWTTSTTRQEVREVVSEFKRDNGRDLFNKSKIVKVKITVEAV